ncbi:MAG TPA: phosphate signaling complex protein PhoU [Pirellulales bacterium]|jgi:phosphate transport system protein|nr:phosphate signaling complex protein PhoU [Pirellulales bacterium]
MSHHLFRQIEKLKQKILLVGTYVEEAIAKAVDSLVNKDQELAASVISSDDEIDRLEVEVEEECLKTLALYQPVAADLRFVIAVLKINNDLERMGDLATNMAKRAIFLAQCERPELIGDIRTMAVKAQSMVKNSLDALVNHDAKLARQVRDADDEVDGLRDEIQSKIRRLMRDEPEKFECWSKLNSASRHVERIADMATNVAEEVIYLIEGEIVRHRPQD